MDAEGKPKINLEVRLGGIYALERIAKDSPKDEWTIMEVLTAYVRQNAPMREPFKLPGGELQHTGTRQLHIVSEHKELNVRADIQAVLTIIGRRDTNYYAHGMRLDLQEAGLGRQT